MARFSMNLSPDGTFIIQGAAHEDIKEFLLNEVADSAFNQQLLPLMIYDRDLKHASFRLRTKEDYQVLRGFLENELFEDDHIVNQTLLTPVSESVIDRVEESYPFDAKFNPQTQVFTVYANNQQSNAIHLLERHFGFFSEEINPQSTPDEASITVTEKDKEKLSTLLRAFSEDLYGAQELATQLAPASGTINLWRPAKLWESDAQLSGNLQDFVFRAEFDSASRVFTLIYMVQGRDTLDTSAAARRLGIYFSDDHNSPQRIIKNEEDKRKLLNMLDKNHDIFEREYLIQQIKKVKVDAVPGKGFFS